ncbi:MAG: NusG domain II-containing protein [Magnetococcales bacterium]|nr:NusG domain II-containing protein [Magnetococcales bacterium]
MAIIGITATFMLQPHGNQAVVTLDNNLINTISLEKDAHYYVNGHLGPVRVEVKNQQIRIVEYDSPRMIGTRTGWVQHNGAITACLPCGVVIRVLGNQEDNSVNYDSIAR